MSEPFTAHRGAVIERRGHLYWLVDVANQLWLDADGDTWATPELTVGTYRLVFAGVSEHLEAEPDMPDITVHVIGSGESDD